MVWSAVTLVFHFRQTALLISRSAGTKLMSLVFAHYFPQPWESPASPTTSEVSFPSLRTGAGVTGRLYHNAVFAKPLTFLGRETTSGSSGTSMTMREPPVAPMVPLWLCVSHQWLQRYVYDHVWATGGSIGTPVTMRDPPVATMVPLWPCVSHQWLQCYFCDHAWSTGGYNGTPVIILEPPVAPIVPLWPCVSHRWLQWYLYDRERATGGSNMTMHEPPVDLMVPLWPYGRAWATGSSKGSQRYRLDVFYETHIFILLYRKFCVSITKPNRLMLFKKDMQPIKTMSGQNTRTVYGTASDVCFYHNVVKR